jgi:O-antigen/teichoic acid export membrane protein
MRRVLWRSLALIAALGVPYLALAAWAAEPLLALAYGGAYAGAAPVVSMWCVVALCSIVSQPVESGLYVARRTRALFISRALAAGVALAAAFVLVPAWGAVGALMAMAGGYALTALGGAWVLGRLRVER